MKPITKRIAKSLSWFIQKTEYFLVEILFAFFIIVSGFVVNLEWQIKLYLFIILVVLYRFCRHIERVSKMCDIVLCVFENLINRIVVNPIRAALIWIEKNKEDDNQNR